MKHYHVLIVAERYNIVGKTFLVKKAKSENHAITIVAGVLRKAYPGLDIFLRDHEARAQECDKPKCLQKNPNQQRLFE